MNGSIEPRPIESPGLSWLWEKLDGWTNWVVLSRHRNSFLSRAVTALSLSSLVLANFPLILIGLEPFTLQLTFAGSLIFLIGYLLFGLWVPPEFSQLGEVHDQVRRMRDISDIEFIKSRLQLSANLIDRMNARHVLKPPQPLVNLLKKKVLSLKDKDAVDQNEAAGLFHADLSLRKHDSPALRLATAGIIIVGVSCLAFSTIRNVLRVIASGMV